MGIWNCSMICLPTRICTLSNTVLKVCCTCRNATVGCVDHGLYNLVELKVVLLYLSYVINTLMIEVLYITLECHMY